MITMVSKILIITTAMVPMVLLLEVMIGTIAGTMVLITN